MPPIPLEDILSSEHPTTTTTTTTSPLPPPIPNVSFSHVQIYTHQTCPLSTYKTLEDQLNLLSSKISSPPSSSDPLSLTASRHLWASITKDDETKTSSDGSYYYTPLDRDLIKQLVSSFGFRILARHANKKTRSYMVASKDAGGVKLIVTSLTDDDDEEEEEGEEDGDDGTIYDGDDGDYAHFDSSNVIRFFESHENREGIAVLAFTVTDDDDGDGGGSSGSIIDDILERYRRYHHRLIKGRWDYKEGDDDDDDTVTIVEVYAYYRDDDDDDDTPDEGTVLRFVRRTTPTTTHLPLPGLVRTPATFDESSQAAYYDHWVSNVRSRTGFLKILEETLGFTPKVDFNAGVVAAGEAQIESTVTGNSPGGVTEGEVLKDQSQVYLPINNALSEVGHVHGFLEEIGQGIQHIASRVHDIISFVQRGNDYREITGEGFTFLKIPRSYYGILTIKSFPSTLLPPNDAKRLFDYCGKHILSPEGAVPLHLTRDELETKLKEGGFLCNNNNTNEMILQCILKSRYENMYSLLGHRLTEDDYLGIVRNQILVDVQGNDLLFQIFTSNILQRNADDEAPFLEFIQRVCGRSGSDAGNGGNSRPTAARKKKPLANDDEERDDEEPRILKPGCGGFGIRNFLTLFLSIEVSKAMHHLTLAKERHDDVDVEFYSNVVTLFTDQLNESNPILTAISNAMIEEGAAMEMVEMIDNGGEGGGDEEMMMWKDKVKEAQLKKEKGNNELMICSQKYKEKMKCLRLERGL